MGRLSIIVSVVALLLPTQVAEACGGFFCSRLPVDQTAERIVFRVNQDTTTMVVQIAYSGEAPDFAWVLPVGSVPQIESLDVFPQRSLSALDANTGPLFRPPGECIESNPLGASAVSVDPSPSSRGVDVHYRAEVGPYEVAAVESEDPMALFDWLQENAFNVNRVMLPYIESYTKEGMKFVALKLQHDADASDIQPFRFDLPGTSPSIPLRLTALAAEPEMSVAVFVLGQERYNGANWPEVQVRDEQIIWKHGTWPFTTNWAALVAKGVDAAGGQGWVTEFAGSTAPLADLLEASPINTPEDAEAANALRELIGDAPYLTRLYTRVSAEEMWSDPIFRRDTGEDVPQLHTLHKSVDGIDQCRPGSVAQDPCLFISCGAGGVCRPVQLDGMQQPVAGCGCVEGATARTTLDPATVGLASGGNDPFTVVCQDARMSFINPGDPSATGGTMEDPCTGFDCGPNGECLAVNMTPTCICDQGYVAVGAFTADGARTTRCEQPMEPVPMAFYDQRLPDLPAMLPGGRQMDEVDMMLPVVEPSMDDLGSAGMPVPRNVSEPARAIGDDAPQGPMGDARSDGADDVHTAVPSTSNSSAGAGATQAGDVDASGETATDGEPEGATAGDKRDSGLLCSARRPAADGGLPLAIIVLCLIARRARSRGPCVTAAGRGATR